MQRDQPKDASPVAPDEESGPGPESSPLRDGRLWRSSRWALSLVWIRHRRLLSATAGITVLRGLLPAGLALTARGLIDSAANLLADGGADRSPLYIWLTLGFLVALTEGLSLHMNNLVVNRLRDQINTSLTVDILKKAARMPLSFFEDQSRRETVERARMGASDKVSLFIKASQAAVTQAFQSLSLIVVLLSVEPLVLVIVGPVALPFLVFQWRLSKRRYDMKKARTFRQRRTAYFSSLLTGPRTIAEIKLLGIADHLVGSYEKIALAFKNEDWALEKRGFVGVASFSVATIAVFYAVLLRVVLKTVQGGASLGDLAIFGGAAVRLRLSLERTITHKTNALEHILYIDDLRRFLSSPEEGRAAAGSTVPGRGEIEFRDVSFSYPGSTVPAISNLSLKVKGGERLALVGRNGAGKSTIVKLLTGLYQPDSGEILIDGVATRSLSEEGLRRSISAVMQHFGMYETSAGENLAYGDWERLRGRPGLVRDLAGRAGVSTLIESLPQGYDTPLGRSFGTCELSGGQWQLLALARGFARETPVIVLDEPTASIDARSELELFRSFAELCRERTTILVSHRFSTIAMADRIAVIEDGRVIESGSHRELLSKNGEYAELYRLHTRWLEEGRGAE
jgi:ATP-binding cassette subfamily B protein